MVNITAETNRYAEANQKKYKMNSRDLIFASFERREPDRVPMLEWSIDPKVRNAIYPGCSYFDFLEKIGMDGVTLVSSSNSIHSSVKPENILAMIAATKRFGKYPVNLAL